MESAEEKIGGPLRECGRLTYLCVQDYKNRTSEEGLQNLREDIVENHNELKKKRLNHGHIFTVGGCWE